MPGLPDRRIVQFLIYILTCAGLIIGLTACNLPTSENPTSAPRTQPVTGEALSTATSTVAQIEPSPTTQPPLVILLAPPGSDTNQAADLQELLTELAAQEGMAFETRETLPQEEIEARLRLVVVIPPDPGATELANANPEVQFLAVGIPGLNTAPNLSLIMAGGDRPDQQGFLAGYLAAVITPDWRVGVISQAEAPSGLAARRGFINGAVFFCGLCRPVYPPYLEYPMFVEIPGGAGPADQQAVADVLINGAVKTVYIPPGTGDESLPIYLAGSGINLIGGSTPPVEVQDTWVATIRPGDLPGAIREAWANLMSGQGGFSLGIPIVLTDRNENLFSPGRQALVEKIMAELLAGFIGTGVDPLTGELR